MESMQSGRRRMLRMLIASGALGAAGASGVISRALAKGDMPPGVNRIEGSADVNGRPARIGTPVNLGDRVSTGKSSQAVIVVGSDAFLLRSQTTIEVGGRDGVLSEMLVATGKVLIKSDGTPFRNASNALRGARLM